MKTSYLVSLLTWARNLVMTSKKLGVAVLLLGLTSCGGKSPETGSSISALSSFSAPDIPWKCIKCFGGTGVGDPCYAGYSGPVYAGINGPCYAGVGGPMYAGYDGPMYAGINGPMYAGVGGPMYAGYDGPIYAGINGNCYAGYGGPVYAGTLPFNGPCYAGSNGPCDPRGTGKNCPLACTVCAYSASQH